MNLSVINQPNNIGAACDFQPWSFYLGGKRVYYGFPNNPDYDLASLAGSICDTINTNISENKNQNELHLFPNPGSGHISISGLKESREFVIKIFDSSGRMVLTKEIVQDQEIDIRKLHPGLYFITVDDNSARTKFIKL